MNNTFILLILSPHIFSKPCKYWFSSLYTLFSKTAFFIINSCIFSCFFGHFGYKWVIFLSGKPYEIRLSWVICACFWVTNRFLSSSLLYFSLACCMYFSQWSATIGFPFLSRNKNPPYPSTVGSFFVFLRFFRIRRNASFTSSSIGSNLVPLVVFVDTISYFISLVLCNWWSIRITSFLKSRSRTVSPQNSEILSPVLNNAQRVKYSEQMQKILFFCFYLSHIQKKNGVFTGCWRNFFIFAQKNSYKTPFFEIL